MQPCPDFVPFDTMTTLAAPTIVSIAKLKLTGFRNYAHLTLNLSPQPVILTGDNGAGKTNILEAISLLFPGRGLRQAKLDEFNCRFGDQQEPYAWAIAADVHTKEGKKTIGTARLRPAEGKEDSTTKRLIKVDQDVVKNQQRLVELCSMVWVTPQMDQVLLTGSSARRKFLDRCVYNFHPDHTTHLFRYEYALKERAKLLRMPHCDPTWLTVLETKLAETGVAITLARQETIEHLQHTINMTDTVFPKALLHLEDEVASLIGNYSSLELEEFCKDRLKENRGVDRQTGRTHFGAHRSDIALWHVEKQMPIAQCSTGEQKALLLTIMLASARAEIRWRGTVPLLLLDEVSAHLDEARREALFHDILSMQAQAWLTGTDNHLFNSLRPFAQFYHVQEGHIKN